MKTTHSLFAAVAVLAACGTVTEQEPEPLNSGQRQLAPPFAPPAWYALTDNGGSYTVTALNGGAASRVFDFTRVDPELDDTTWKQALSAPSDVLLFGRVRLRSFEVHAAYRALPGVLPIKPVAVYQPTHVNIACFVAPCPSWELAALDGSPDSAVETIDLSRTLKPGVDEAWLFARMEQGRTVLAGVASAPYTLDVRALYLRLPERASCPAIFWRPGCQEPDVAVFSRDAERCMSWQGCATPGPCIEKPMQCAKGYTEIRFATLPNACEVVRCDPEFAQ